MIDIYEQIKCVEREIAMRERAYPRWVSQGKITQAKADQEINTMKKVRETLKSLILDHQLTLGVP